jgi:hypothetical protein
MAAALVCVVSDGNRSVDSNQQSQVTTWLGSTTRAGHSIAGRNNTIV